MPAAASRRCLFAVRLVDIDVEYAKPVAELDWSRKVCSERSSSEGAVKAEAAPSR